MTDTVEFELHFVEPVLVTSKDLGHSNGGVNTISCDAWTEMALIGRTCDDTSAVVTMQVFGAPYYFYIMLDEEVVDLVALADTSNSELVPLTGYAESVHLFSVEGKKSIYWYTEDTEQHRFARVEMRDCTQAMAIATYFRSKQYSVYEGHISYRMQFMMDAAISGMQPVSVDLSEAMRYGNGIYRVHVSRIREGEGQRSQSVKSQLSQGALLHYERDEKCRYNPMTDELPAKIKRRQVDITECGIKGRILVYSKVAPRNLQPIREPKRGGNPMKVALEGNHGLRIACLESGSTGELALLLYSAKTGVEVHTGKVLEHFAEFDPDILLSFDSSWKPYLPGLQLNRPILGRRAKQSMSTVLLGRLVVDAWQVLRREPACKKLPSYTFPQICKALLGVEHAPSHMGQDRAVLVLTMFLRTLTTQVEAARFFHIDLHSAAVRGSQYRVEALLLRRAHSRGFLAWSPSGSDVRAMPALEVPPLILQPDSAFYDGHLGVFDFQSLYPSIIIAYNMCFSTLTGTGITGTTCTGSGSGTGGFTAPNGSSFTNATGGVLPAMLHSLLTERVRIKEAMAASSDPVERASLEARQLALKGTCNTTYGYTAATFSGRMPNPAVADGIVSTARALLQFAISFVENFDARARVVYGDTDSLFVHFPGAAVRSSSEAIAILKRMAAEVSARLPSPVALRLDKIYAGAILLTKKRYAGLIDGTSSFDAKGIEAVRRDSCGLVARTTREFLERILPLSSDVQRARTALAFMRSVFERVASVNHRSPFDPVDLTKYILARSIKRAVEEQDSDEDNDNANEEEEELLFAGIRERLASKLTKSSDSPSTRRRVPYLVVQNNTSTRLLDRILPLATYIRDPTRYRIDITYYIRKLLLPCFTRFLSVLRPATLATQTVAQLGSLADDAIMRAVPAARCLVCAVLLNRPAPFDRRYPSFPPNTTHTVIEGLCPVCSHPATKTRSLRVLLQSESDLLRLQHNILQSTRAVCGDCQPCTNYEVCSVSWRQTAFRISTFESQLSSIRTAIEKLEFI